MIKVVLITYLIDCNAMFLKALRIEWIAASSP